MFKKKHGPSSEFYNESGFTLVELLVVIAIIAILTAIAVPTFLNQRKSAHDAAVRNDLKTAATSVHTWLTDGHSWADLKAITGTHALSIYGANHGLSEPNAHWNSFEELPYIAVSESTVLGITIQPAIDGYWNRLLDEGEFCITGRSLKSNYGYPGNDFGRYDELLYYDVKLGGIVTMQEMVDATNSGLESSCDGFGNRYKNAHGLS